MSFTATIYKITIMLNSIIGSDPFKEFAKQFAGEIGKTAGQALGKALIELLSTAPSKENTFSDEERRLINRHGKEIYRMMFYNYGIFSRMIAFIRFTAAGGLLIVGPSGAGKSSIRHTLTMSEKKELNPTLKLIYKKISIPNRKVVLTDSPGGDLKGIVRNLRRRNKKNLLVLVLAAGMLETRAHKKLQHPLSGEFAFASPGQFIYSMLANEIAYLNRLCEENIYSDNGYRSFMLVINKMDQWKAIFRPKDIVDYYKGRLTIEQAQRISDKIKSDPYKHTVDHQQILDLSRQASMAIRRMATLYCIPGIRPTTHLVAAEYQDFHDVVGTADGTTKEECEFSKAILRLNIMLRLKHLI